MNNKKQEVLNNKNFETANCINTNSLTSTNNNLPLLQKEFTKKSNVLTNNSKFLQSNDSKFNTTNKSDQSANLNNYEHFNTENFWSKARTVILNRQPNETFGISIVGGRVEVSQKNESAKNFCYTVFGIFIKSVIPDSLAGKSGKIFMGDRVLSVNDVDLMNATHELAVHVIKNATNPVKFVVQSLQNLSPNQMQNSFVSVSELKNKQIDSFSNNKFKNNTLSSNNNENTPKVFNEIKKIEAKSAGALKKLSDDIEEEDDFFYTQDKIKRKYSDLPGTPILIRLENIPPKGIKFSLANLSQEEEKNNAKKKNVILVDIKSTSFLHLHVGDELLEINGKVLFGLSHLEASEKIRECCQDDKLVLIILRRSKNKLTDKNVIKYNEQNNDNNKTTLNKSCVNINKNEPFISEVKITSKNDTNNTEKNKTNVLIGSDINLINNNCTDKEQKKSWQQHYTNSHQQMCTTSNNEQVKPIESGKETLIEIDKEGRGLGLSLVGGSDTVLGAIIIHEIYPDGAAAIDGRLKPGDQLLEVNNVSLRGSTHEQAILLLRRTMSKVRLLISRDVNLHASLLDPTQMYNIINVDLMKKPGKGIGVSIVGRKNEPGVYISEILKGGVAEVDGRLMQGDQILSVNNHDVQFLMQEDVAAILKTCVGRVNLRVGRWKLAEAANCVNSAQLNNNNNYQLLLQQQQNTNMSTSSPTNATKNGDLNENKFNFNANNNNKLNNSNCNNNSNYSRNLGSAHYNVENSNEKTIPPLQITLHDENEQQTVIKADLSPVSEEDMKLVAETVPITEESSNLAMQRESCNNVKTNATSSNINQPSTSHQSSSSNVKLLQNVKLRTDLKEEGSQQLLITLQKDDGNQWGMGIGKRQRGILITSLQPGSTAAEKLTVGDRIMAVNENEVTDQLSAVTFVRESGNNVILQIARPIQSRVRYH